MKADILILTHFKYNCIKNYHIEFYDIDSKFDNLIIAYDNMFLNYNTAKEYSALRKKFNTDIFVHSF